MRWLTGIATTLTLGCLAAPALAQQWDHCAAQGETCDLDGIGIVRYGADNRWFYAVGTDRYLCDVPMFGDPATGVEKSCQRWRLPDEAARNSQMNALRNQVQEMQDELQARAEQSAALEEELELTRERLRDLRRGIIRREERRPR